jgi:hypothetical protein
MSSELNGEPLVIISLLSSKHELIEKSHVKIGVRSFDVVLKMVVVE